MDVPDVDVGEVRLKMGLSQAQFATKFGFPPATLRNREQGRSRPEGVEDVLRKAS
jgi:putative transcriptional regulator